LTQALRDQIAPAGFEFLSPMKEKNRCGILTFRHPKIASERFADALTKNDIIVSLRYDRANGSWLRVSPHFYNTDAEIATIAELLIQGAAV
jgi:cysteine desulfurase/selenocysteine lyase